MANRLRKLTERNAELLAENIALQDGSRVEEYQERISYHESQLELLKRRVGADDDSLAGFSARERTLSLLVYNARGRILRLEAAPEQLTGSLLANIFGAEKVKQSNAFSSVVAGLAIKAGS